MEWVSEGAKPAASTPLGIGPTPQDGSRQLFTQRLQGTRAQGRRGGKDQGAKTKARSS